MRLVDGSRIKLFSTEFVEECILDSDPPSLTALAREHYRAPPCRGDEVEIDDGAYPGQRRYAICAAGPCSIDADCPAPNFTASPQPKCSYEQSSTGLMYCVLGCATDDDCLGGPDGDLVKCRKHDVHEGTGTMTGRCMAATTIRNMTVPASMSQRYQYPQRRQDPMYYDLPVNSYLDDDQLDNPYAGRVEFGKHTESVDTVDFVRDGDLLPLPHNRTQLCHYALRLTPPERAMNTASWSRFKQLVVYGFVTEFHFRVLHRSKECIVAGQASEWCAEAGADGFAFVIQNFGRKVVGSEVAGMGYAISRSLAIEFDMHRDIDLADPSANHVSVMVAPSMAAPNTANHDVSQVAFSSDVPLLQEGTHIVRIEYDTKSFKWDSILRDFEADLNADYLRKHSSGRPGLLSVWVDGKRIIMVPLDLIQVVEPDGTATAAADTPIQPNESAYDELGQSPGRAWVGFTSSTNYQQWQSVDIVSWSFKEQFPCPLEDESAHLTAAWPGMDPGRHAYCDLAWTPETPTAEVPETHDRPPVGYDTPCSYDGSLLCHVEIKNIAREPIRFSGLTEFHQPYAATACRDGILQWNHIHPYFLGCSRYVYFPQSVKELWVNTLDGSRAVIISDNQVLQKAPAPFKRRNHGDSDAHWQWCVQEHPSDPARFQFAECNCEYCVRQLDILASYAVFYQHECSERFGLFCPCFEASEASHDSSVWQYQEPLKFMRVHICRGCAYTSHCSQMLKVAVCEEAYQTYHIGNPLAPDTLNNGLTDRYRDQGRVPNGQIRGDVCDCEPNISPYRGSARTGMCEEGDFALAVESFPNLPACADMCRNAARCTYFMYWDQQWETPGLCIIVSDCMWVGCTSKPTAETKNRCYASNTYRLAPLGNYLDTRGDMQAFNIFPLRTLQTNFDECKQCLFLYDEEYCLAQCGLPKQAPYVHWPAGQSCGTCIFAGNRMLELTDFQTRSVKGCVYQAIRDSQDPWVACNETAKVDGGAQSGDLFNGVSTHYLSECPGKPFAEYGAVCVPNKFAREDFPLQVLSRMAARNDTVWGDGMECLNAMCRLVPRETCYEVLASFNFNGHTDDDLRVIQGERFGIIKPQLQTGFIIFQRESGWGANKQYILSTPLPYFLENFTLEGWIYVGTAERVTNMALEVPITSNRQWREDYPASNAVDGIPKTYWSSQLGTPSDVNHYAVWECDLGIARYSGMIKIFWKEPASDFQIQIKVDEDADWEPLDDVRDNELETTVHDVFFQARWVRVVMTKALRTRLELVPSTIKELTDDYLSYPVFSIREFEVLKDDMISRLKPTNRSLLYHRPSSLALDGDFGTFWAAPPGTEAADLFIDFGEVMPVTVITVSWRYKPVMAAIFVGTVACGECPWIEHTGLDNVMECESGVRVDVTSWATQTWNGCTRAGSNHQGGRHKCPKNFPLMCNEPCDTSGPENDWCCASDCTDHGGLRHCPAENAIPYKDPIWKKVGNQITKEILISGDRSIRCLRLQVERAAMVYGDWQVGVEEIQVYGIGENMITYSGSATPYYTLPSEAINESVVAFDGSTPIFHADGRIDRYWAVELVDDLAVLIVDLGEVKGLMSLEVVFATSPAGKPYKASRFALSVGLTPDEFEEVDRQNGFVQLERYVLMGWKLARYVKLEVFQIFSSNPDGKFGLAAIRAFSASENYVQRDNVAVNVTAEWVAEPGTEFAEYISGDDLPHGPHSAIDDDFDTWWGATLNTTGILDVGAGRAEYEIILDEPALISIAAVRWRFPADAVTLWCAQEIDSRYLQVGAKGDNTAYLTPIVFLGSRRCKKVKLILGKPLDEYAGCGIIGITEVELYNFLIDFAYGAPVTDDSGHWSAHLATDPDTKTRWEVSSARRRNLTVDLGDANYFWAVNLLFPSNAVPQGFTVAVANSSNSSHAWAADDQYIILEEITRNSELAPYIFTRGRARYVRIMFLSTRYSTYAVRGVQVYGGPNYAHQQTPLAVDSWNHSVAQAMDGLHHTFWLAEPLSTAARIRVDLKDEYFIAGGIQIYWKFPAMDFKVLASKDTIEWEELYNATGNLDDLTLIGKCFSARYVEVEMTMPDKLNGDGAYAINEFRVRFDSNLAHCKSVSTTSLVNNSLFLKENVIDGNEDTFWMPPQGVISTNLTIDMLEDSMISGFYITWHYPPRIFFVEYDPADQPGNWTFIKQWGPSEKRRDLPVELRQFWGRGYAVRSLRIVIVETAVHEEGRLCGISEFKVYYPTNENLVLRRPITATSWRGSDHVAEFINDGNERGTYWRPEYGVSSATIEITLDPLPVITGEPPPGHDVGRIQIMWRFVPGYFIIHLYYDTGWWMVYEGYGADELKTTNFALYHKATSIKMYVEVADFEDPHVAILQLKVYAASSRSPPAVAPVVPWQAAVPYMIDKIDPLTTESNVESFWMSPNRADRIEIIVDLFRVYNAFDIQIYFGFRPQMFECLRAVNLTGPWTEVKMTSVDPPGMVGLETLGEDQPLRYLKLWILRGYRDEKGLFGTSIRDIAVYIFRNYARNTTASSNSMWDYGVSKVVDGDRTTRWVSRFDTSIGQLIVDLEKVINVAGMSWEFEWGAGRYEVLYKVEESDPWSSAVLELSGQFTGLVEIPTTVHFRARYIMLDMRAPLVRVYHPDTVFVEKTDRPVFSVLDLQVKEHTGGGGAFGIQSLDGLQYNTITYGLRQPGQWILASENEIFTKDLDEPPVANEELGNWVHIAATFQTLLATDTGRKTVISMYRNGQPFGNPYVREQSLDRLTLPNETRLIIGVRSSAYDVMNADKWPPWRSGIDPTLKESPTAGQWPSEDDPVQHGSSHSPYFDGRIRKVALLKNALAPEEVRGVYMGVQLGCHCYDACPFGSNRFHPGVQVPCSGQGVCRRLADARPFQSGYCECLPGFSGANCENHCSVLSSIGCCDVDDDCPPGVACNLETKACAV